MLDCRHCGNKLEFTFIDLGFAPPSNAYLSEENLSSSEKYYPLKVMVCSQCWLVQTEDYTDEKDLFSHDYAYFSSTSLSFLNHAKEYSSEIIQDLNLNHESLVIEIASNDGYLLKNFVEANVPCLGIEPTESTADKAESLGIPVIKDFFGSVLAEKIYAEGKSADLIIGNNVLAHVPDINDFCLGLKRVLNVNGTITLEFPHLMRLLEYSQFDTIYHEHFSYLSLYTASLILQKAGLRVFDVKEIPTHGGSLRIYVSHNKDLRRTSQRVENILLEESKRGMLTMEVYSGFQQKAESIKNDFVNFLLDQKKRNKKVGAYGAAAKGNTLINFAGIKPDLLSYVCDAAKSKQGKYLPGSHIPILEPTHLSLDKPDYVIIMPWNISQEIMESVRKLVSNSTKLLTFIPEKRLHSFNN